MSNKTCETCNHYNNISGHKVGYCKVKSTKSVTYCVNDANGCKNWEKKNER